jgi:hypothetical protein
MDRQTPNGSGEKREVAEASMVELHPLIERLVAEGFQWLARTEPTVVATPLLAAEFAFTAPEGWAACQESSPQTLAARVNDILAQGPVFLVPPWDRPTDLETRKDRARMPEYQFVDVLRGCKPPGPDAVMAVLLPADVWASDLPWAADLRVSVAEHWDTLLVVYASNALTQLHRSAQVTAIFLRSRSQPRPPLKIFRVPPRPDVAGVEEDFGRLLVRGGGRVTHGYVIRDVPDPHEGLYFERFDPEVLNRRADLAGFGSVDRLGDLYSWQSMNVNVRNAQTAGLLCSPDDPGAVRLISPRDVGRDGAIAPPSEDSNWLRVDRGDEPLLQPGDLVIRRLLALNPVVPHGFIVAEVTSDDLPAAVTEQVVVLRPAKALEPQQARLAVMFLRTPLALALAGPGSTIVTANLLTPLPIPQPDEALARALDDLAVVKQQLHDWETEAQTLLDSVFLEKSAALARQRIIGSGRSLRLRVEAASLLDDLGHTVRTRFPYPIAYRWREAEARISAGDSHAAYGAVLDTAEILLCYTAQLALALTRECGITLGAVTAIKGKLAGGRSGPGFGDWVSVLSEVTTSRKLSDLPTEHLLNDIATLLATQDAEAARQRLSDSRNDQAHLRRVDPIDLPHATESAFADLTHLVERARFLADWPLLQITEIRWDALARTAAVQYRELMGDHPVVPTRAMAAASNDLETGSLYLRDPEGDLHLLRPFLIGRDCPTCRTWSTFHVDRVRKAAVILKSLEHGHVVEETTPAASTVLRQVGLL